MDEAWVVGCFRVAAVCEKGCLTNDRVSWAAALCAVLAMSTATTTAAIFEKGRASDIKTRNI